MVVRDFSCSSPMQIHQQLKTDITESIISRARIQHEGLNAFLRERLAGDPRKGGLLSDQIFQSAPNYVSSNRYLDQLSELLHPRTIDVIKKTPCTDLRFDYPAYEHQLKTWKCLSSEDPKSVLVSSGTGSGKTECFLVPILDDLIRQVEKEGSLTGVRALMLYPLNALIASQEKRLAAWTKPLGRDVRFALYNGLMKDEKNVRARDIERAKRETPHQVLYRPTLRDDPPPILVTNQTMLEYMTIRHKDRPILDKSRGKLRWIVIDEAHSYIGSAAAELSLLLRRVMEAFDVTPDQVRFVATSATIGSADDEKSVKSLQSFLADIAGIPPSSAHVVVGKSQPIDLLKVQATSKKPEAAKRIAQELDRKPQTLASLKDVAPDAEEILLDLSGRSTVNGAPTSPALPMRAHSFMRVIAGLWTCINPGCRGKSRPRDWPFGSVLFEQSSTCPSCQSMVFEIHNCFDCGELFLPADDRGDWIGPRQTGHDTDEFRQDSARDRDDEGGDEEKSWSEEPSHLRWIAVNPKLGRSIAFDVKKGTITGEAGNFHLARSGEGRCPSCHGNRKRGQSAIFPLRFGTPFLTQNAAPILLEGVSARQTGCALPFDGRQLISFSDSRQGTARLAANVETNGERGFIRSFIYHAVQKAAQQSDLTEDERKKLLDKKKAYERLSDSTSMFRDEISRIDAQLNGNKVAGIKWETLVSELARESAIGMMAEVWDRDRSDRYHDNHEALAGFMLRRELARRPRNANAVETLGLARFRFPDIERIYKDKLPEVIAERGYRIEDWRNFLYFLVDWLRGYFAGFAVNMDDEDARWLPGRARPCNVIGPGQSSKQKRDIEWPKAKSKGVQTIPVQLLTTALNLDTSTSRDRDVIKELLDAAWDQMQPLLEGAGGTYSLRLEKCAEIEAVVQTWKCPLTRRVLPRLVFGQSPSLIGFKGKNQGQPQEIEFPRLPYTHPLTSDDRRALAKWLSGDDEVQNLRRLNLWTHLHDRIALASPYLRAEEHSAQQPPHRLRDFEEQFKEGGINLLACSTTMEMGVDIGSIETVLMTNVPPSIANYNQRVGRAGRRGQGFSTSLVIARNTPLDLETFAKPVDYLRRKLASPRVSLDSIRITQRHANAWLLARWFCSQGGDFAETKTGKFFGCRQDLNSFEGLVPVDEFCDWLGCPGTAEDTKKELKRILKGTGLEHKTEIWKRSAEMFKEQAKDFLCTWERLKDDVDKLDGAAKTAIKFQAKRLCNEFLLKELANRSLIPGSGFPTAVVPFDTYCKSYKRNRLDDASGGARARRYECPTRNADIAIREYAPGAEVVVDGLVWTSAGVTLNWLSPIDSEKREPQNLRWAWWCDSCGAAGSDHKQRGYGDCCGDPHIKTEQFLEPAGFRVEWTARPHTDTDQAVYIEPQSPQISVGEAEWAPLLRPESGRIRASHEGHIYHHSKGPGKKGYEICLECGRAAADLPENHSPLTPRGDRNKAKRCRGNDNPFAITNPIALGYEVRTDVVEVQMVGLERGSAAWAIGAALRGSLARWLGIEPGELGISVARRKGTLGREAWSVYLFDQASGGAGYAPKLLDEIYQIFERAKCVLDCPKKCEKGCSACVLTADLYKQQDRLDPRSALDTIRGFLETNSNLAKEDQVVADAEAISDAANTLVLKARSGDEIAIFLPEEFDLAALGSTKMVSLFGTVSARGGVSFTLVFAAKMFSNLEDVERRFLRDSSVRYDLKLATGEVEKGLFGHHRLAELRSENQMIGFFSRDAGAALPGARWGVGDTHAVVAGTIDDPISFSEVEREDLERQGDQVELIEGFAQCSVRDFGKRFVEKLKPKMEAAGVWKRESLVKISYTDRYLNAPLPMLLLLRTCQTLSDELRTDEPAKINVAVQPLKQDRQPYLIFHDWACEDARVDVARWLGDRLDLDVELHVKENPAHGRRLELEYADGLKTVILLDQGFGYWRTTGRSLHHNFRAKSEDQARALLNSKVSVFGAGESYYAIKKQEGRSS